MQSQQIIYFGPEENNFREIKSMEQNGENRNRHKYMWALNRR